MNNPPIEEIVLELIKLRRFNDLYNSAAVEYFIEHDAGEAEILETLKDLIKNAKSRLKA